MRALLFVVALLFSTAVPAAGYYYADADGSITLDDTRPCESQAAIDAIEKIIGVPPISPTWAEVKMKGKKTLKACWQIAIRGDGVPFVILGAETGGGVPIPAEQFRPLTES